MDMLVPTTTSKPTVVHGNSELLLSSKISAVVWMDVAEQKRDLIPVLHSRDRRDGRAGESART